MTILEKSIKRYSPIPSKDKKHAKNEVGHYNYRVPGAWQGRWQCLKGLCSSSCVCVRLCPFSLFVCVLTI
jgi:hypothetical protein